MNKLWNIGRKRKDTRRHRRRMEYQDMRHMDRKIGKLEKEDILSG